MATVHGKDGSLTLDSNAIAVCNGFTLEIANEVAEQSVIGSDWRDYLAGQAGFTVELEGYVDRADTGYQELVQGATVAFVLSAEGGGTGTTSYSGSAIISSISEVSANDAVVTFSASLQGTGELLTVVNS